MRPDNPYDPPQRSWRESITGRDGFRCTSLGYVIIAGAVYGAVFGVFYPLFTVFRHDLRLSIGDFLKLGAASISTVGDGKYEFAVQMLCFCFGTCYFFRFSQALSAMQCLVVSVAAWCSSIALVFFVSTVCNLRPETYTSDPGHVTRIVLFTLAYIGTLLTIFAGRLVKTSSRSPTPRAGP